MIEQEREKKNLKPICADCRKMQKYTRVCLVTNLKVKRTDPACNAFASRNPRYG